MLDPAPFHHDVAEGPSDAGAWWLTTADEVRIRMAAWPKADAKGTLLLFPGRTEYVEKYGRAAADFAARGYAMAAVDWRGQGLADRLLADRLSGHVLRFPDYQQDVAAMVAAAVALELPQPWYLLGHSMGGAIALRALIEGIDVRAAVFSAPMWGIHLSRPLQLVAERFSWMSVQMGFASRYAPGTKPESYVNAEPFQSNLLTNDTAMFEYMGRQTMAYPDLRLGGPSMGWLHEALVETRRLSLMPPPELPVLTFVGSEEAIVDVPRIQARMSAWPGGALEEIPGARHEVMMETPTVRRRVFDRAAELFDAHP